MFNIGDRVVIILEGWKDKYPKVYTITAKHQTYDGFNLYKLRGVPGWGLGNMIEFAERNYYV